MLCVDSLSLPLSLPLPPYSFSLSIKKKKKMCTSKYLGEIPKYDYIYLLEKLPWMLERLKQGGCWRIFKREELQRSTQEMMRYWTMK